MKKILNLLTIIVLSSSTASTVVSCTAKKTTTINPTNYDRSNLAKKIINKDVYINNDKKDYKLVNIYNQNSIINALKSQNPSITKQDSQYITIKNTTSTLSNDTFNNVVLNVNEGQNKNIDVTIRVTPYGTDKTSLYKALKEKVTDNQITLPEVPDLKTNGSGAINTNNDKVRDFIKKTLRTQNSYLSSSDMEYIHIERNKTITKQPQTIKINWYKGSTAGISSDISVKIASTQDINNIMKDTKFDTYNNQQGKIFLNVYNHNVAKQPKIDNNVIKPASNLYNLLFGSITTNSGLEEKEQVENALRYDKVTLRTTGANNDKDFLRNVEASNEQQASESSFNEYKAFMDKAFLNYKNSYKTLQDIQTDYNNYRTNKTSFNLVNFFNTNVKNTSGYNAKQIMTNWIRLNTSVYNEMFGKDLASRLVGFFEQVRSEEGQKEGQIEDSYEYRPKKAITRISLSDMSKDTYENIKAEYDKGAHLDTSMGHIFTHEYGHAINWGLMLKANYRKLLNNNSGPYVGTSNPPLYTTPPQIYLLKYLDYVGHISSTNKNWSWLFANDLVNSTYGRSLRMGDEPGQPELIADAFAQWMYQPLEITNGALTVTNDKLAYKNISKVNAGWEVLNYFFLHVLPTVYNVVPVNTITI